MPRASFLDMLTTPRRQSVHDQVLVPGAFRRGEQKSPASSGKHDIPG
jgi:hypothetical protein